MLRSSGPASALRGDVPQIESVSTLVSETLKRFGASDVLVNNAAINKAAPLDQVTEKSFDEHFVANVKSAVHVAGGRPRIQARRGHHQYQLVQLPLSERPPLQRHESGFAEHGQRISYTIRTCSVRSVAPVSLGEHVRQYNRGGGHKRVGLTGKA
jgi:NAD(P)-dependent dehydrogenase (short-subunit alcohol dehydrogenase family)